MALNYRVSVGLGGLRAGVGDVGDLHWNPHRNLLVDGHRHLLDDDFGHLLFADDRHVMGHRVLLEDGHVNGHVHGHRGRDGQGHLVHNAGALRGGTRSRGGGRGAGEIETFFEVDPRRQVDPPEEILDAVGYFDTVVGCFNATY